MRSLRLLGAVFVLSAALAAGGVMARAGSPSPSPAAPTAVGACPTPSTVTAGSSAPKVPNGCPEPCPALNVAVPDRLAGLSVTAEDPCAEFRNASGRLALDAVALYSLRQPDKLLMATLEIGRFVKAAPLGDTSFRNAILDRVGDSQPQQLLVGRNTVYVTTSPGLVLVSWFRQHYLLILVERDSYQLPKTLLRAVLEFEP